jgi:hypothetical protein
VPRPYGVQAFPCYYPENCPAAGSVTKDIKHTMEMATLDGSAKTVAETGYGIKLKVYDTATATYKVSSPHCEYPSATVTPCPPPRWGAPSKRRLPAASR